METAPKKDNRIHRYLDAFAEILLRTAPPDKEVFRRIVENTVSVLRSEDPGVRPMNSNSMPGGIIALDQSAPTIIVPDIHGRMNFLFSVLTQPLHDGKMVADRLGEGTLQVVCVGDGLHSEDRGAARWKKAYEEFLNGYKKHRAMDDEMREGFGVMEMVMLSKMLFPGHFHFLKGNHENISNEKKEGNHPFRKYALESLMVLEYVKKFYGDAFLRAYYDFEKELPLLAVGKDFLVSHAEPADFFSRDDLLEYRNRPEVVEGLTWTVNNDAEPGSVEAMLVHHLGVSSGERAYYFGGHRPVKELYNLRAEGRYVQICTPHALTIALVADQFDPAKDVIRIEDRANF